jgi:glycerophosphoryl diester phosphodiesterase
VITIARQDGRPLRIGHRGARALAPENTLASFRAAVEGGVDVIEFDVIRHAGALVVAHASGDVGPDTPSLDEALRFFVDEAPAIGAHLDLKVTKCEGEVVEALKRHGLVARSFVSSYYLSTARAIAAHDGDVRTGLTIPRRAFRISDSGRSAPVARVVLRVLRWVTPILVRPLLALTRASDLVPHHSLVTSGCVRAAHARSAAVVTWTVDDPIELGRVERAGVDGIVTNDPRIFASATVSTLPA